MWSLCTLNELPKGNYVAVATFDGDIVALASQLDGEATRANEETGSIEVVHLVGANGKGALLLSHQFGDPKSVEVRLAKLDGVADPTWSASDLEAVLSAVGVSKENCTWVSPSVF